MFEKYSEEARQAIFLARFEAGNLGGPTIDLHHLLAGIVLQDQNDWECLYRGLQGLMPGSGMVEHPPRTGDPFFTPEAAAALLAKVREDQRAPALPTHGDMPLSEDCGKVLKETDELARELKHTLITPLHLLAAALNVESSRGAVLLREHGITRETVLAKLRNDGE